MNNEDSSQLSDSNSYLQAMEKIASGGMAHVFRAHQPHLDRYIAVKKLKAELTTNSEVLERFRREAKSLASVLHQNVAHVYDYVETSDEAYIVMEYIDGIDLSQIILKLGSIPPAIAATILLGVANGVQHIHTHHLIHRDIKPSNIRITNRGAVKLMDFGIVMDVDKESLTRPGTMVGSPHYLSPEQVLGDTLSPQSDIFLMGIVLYEMLTGTRPFKEEEGETVYQRIREVEYTPISKMSRHIPSSLQKIVKRCLQKNPVSRYENMKGLIRDLENFLGERSRFTSEDILLSFLEEEALLKPQINYNVVSYQKSISVQKKWIKKIAIPILILGIGMALGYLFSRLQAPFISPLKSNVMMPR
jgi:serine/threonine-protein kinase